MQNVCNLKKTCLKCNIQNSAIKPLYLTKIKQCIKNMSLREEEFFVGKQGL